MDRLGRVTTAAAGVCFALLGVVMFVAPGWSADEFAWSVSDFVAMTIGAWALGTAWMAYVVVRREDWSETYACRIFLWLFPVAELAVVARHNDGLITDGALSWPYLVTLGVGAVAAVVGAIGWLRERPTLDPVGPATPRWVRVFVALFVLLTAYITFATLRAGEGSLNGDVFPEPITPFTVRAFGALFLSVGLAVVPLVWARTMGPIATFALGGLGLAIPITIAALVHADLFDLGDHPFNAFYLGVYLVLIVAAAYLIWSVSGEGSRQPPPARRSPDPGRGP